MDASSFAFLFVVVVVMQASCLHASFYPGTGPRTSLDLCPSGYYNSLALCPKELECSDHSNCSSQHVCCRNFCGTSTCVVPSIREEITEDQSLCLNTTCPGQGKRCLVFNERTWCVCVTECQRVSSNRYLVCDQNGSTYLSRCHLDKRACQTGRQLIPTRCVSLPGNARVEGRPIAVPFFNTYMVDHTAEVGDTVQFICQPNGNPRPTIYWQNPDGKIYPKDPSDYLEYDRITVTSTGRMTIENTVMADSGKYLCIAISSMGIAIKTVILKIQEPRNIMPSGRSFHSRVDCSTFPIQQADRCGPIRDYTIKHMWVYNKSKNSCEKQYFRDCHAITNKFTTLEHCNTACVKDVCALPPLKGPCRALVARIAYDPERGICGAFVYGGCGGNLNNFPDVYECARICGSGTHRAPMLRSRCQLCKKLIPKRVCASDFVIVGDIKYFQANRFKSPDSSLRGYLQVDIHEVLADWSTNLNLRQKNLSNSREARMTIRINLDADCPCPRINDISPIESSRFVGSRHRRFGRSSRVSAIIAGNVVNNFPTITPEGLAQRKTNEAYRRVVSSVNFPALCSEILRIESLRPAQ